MASPVYLVTGYGQTMFLLGRGFQPTGVFTKPGNHVPTYTFGPEARQAVEDYFAARDTLADVPAREDNP